MNHFTKQSKHAVARASHGSLRNLFSRVALAFLGIITLASLTAVPARAAGCGEPDGRLNGVKFPMFEQRGAVAPDTIVGLWQVTYTTSSDAPFGVSLKQWHSDGTENDNIDHSPVIGNVCFGVWKQIGPRKVRLHHTGWLFDDSGNPIGSFIQYETDTVAGNGMTYTGSFDFKVYDTNGDFVPGSEVTGTIAATRITAD